MNTVNEKNSRGGSKIYREQLATIEDLELLKKDLLNEINDIKSLLRGTTAPGRKEWLKSSEVRKMLGISPGTLQNMRTNDQLPFTKIGGITFYRYEDIAKLLAGSSENA
ncbi:helix-turn-helix domain-containing protein [Fulvivirgaceae bacterium PWU4]|uniref:Helix-turn-helix domain-containing protein n=1 Tax=Chryseosolibacter histidini TaxID=2782349 RepID=A0AAP2DL44_9BACT|nr:helix-turn-helix domain-containing protein [Chryseosolibacter histidini]MBT1697157.1 helix-turn-helix domain-containing protein [Chryseosolibacter histidini]